MNKIENDTILSGKVHVIPHPREMLHNIKFDYNVWRQQILPSIRNQMAASNITFGQAASSVLRAVISQQLGNNPCPKVLTSVYWARTEVEAVKYLKEHHILTNHTDNLRVINNE